MTETKQMTKQNQQPEIIEISGVKYQRVEEKKTERTPAEEAFKRVYSYYPEGCETSVWVAFQKGYEQSQKDYKIEEPVKTKSLYQFLAEWKYGIEEGDKIPQFDNDEFGVLDWSQIFIDYLYEEGDIIFENEDEIIVKFKQTQLGIPNE
jgi:hypothetical protein